MGKIRATLLASNEFGALVGSNQGEVIFLDSNSMMRADELMRLDMPRAMGEGLGVVIPDMINFGPSRHIDYRQYSHEEARLSAIAAFDSEDQIWFVHELPAMPSILRLT